MSKASALIHRWCREGDENAFRDFYRSQAGCLWRFLVARGAEPETAYDLLSEAFLRFIQVACKDPASPVALLYRIALNLHIDSHRRQQTADRFRHDPAANPGHSDPPSDDHEALRRLMRRALHADEQNLLLMRYWIGLTHREIAGILGLPEGTVRRQAAAALKKLAERWREET